MTEAVVFDLDDTLLRNDRTISDFTVDVMRSLAGHGIRILPASGRARESMEGFVRQLNCCDTFIACNGAEIWNTDGNCLYASVLPPDVAQDIIAFGKKYHVYMHTYDGPYFYYNVESHWSREYASATLLTGRWKPDLEQFLPMHPTCKILMMDAPDMIASMREEATHLFEGRASVTTSKPTFLEFNPLNTSKGLALKWCADHLHFRLNETLAFGDSLNDLSMLHAAGRGIAVANARKDVLCEVDDVCLSNEEDGVAHYLLNHVSL